MRRKGYTSFPFHSLILLIVLSRKKKSPTMKKCKQDKSGRETTQTGAGPKGASLPHFWEEHSPGARRNPQPGIRKEGSAVSAFFPRTPGRSCRLPAPRGPARRSCCSGPAPAAATAPEDGRPASPPALNRCASSGCQHGEKELSVRLPGPVRNDAVWEEHLRQPR